MNTVDSEGNELSKEQMEYFKNSKVVDDKGNLLVMYHGTDSDFDVFSHKFIGDDGKDGFGFYFINKLSFSYDYPKAVYLNITNPATDGDLIADIIRREYELSKRYTDKEAILIQIQKEFNVDGIIDYGRGGVVIAFNSNQIKYISNKKPTNSINMKENIFNITAKLLEGFRDYDRVIDDISAQMYNILDKYRYWGEGSANLSEMELDNDDMETQDVIRFYNLQKKLIFLENQREEEYNNEVSNLPPETTKTNFEGFDITKTDPSYDEYFIKGNKDRDYVLNKGGYTDAYIAEMTPEEYLKLCGKYGWQHIYDNIDEIIEHTPDKHLIDEYAEMFKQGKKAPMPVLDINHRSQEGRHRALACVKAGIKTMPVLIKV